MTSASALLAPTSATSSSSARWSWFRGADSALFFAVFMLVTLGSLLVLSATRPRLIVAGENPEAIFYKHLINIGVGVVCALLAMRLNYRLLRLYAPFFFGLSLIGLVLVLVIGSTINGSRSWIVLPGGFSLQPSEFAKVGLILIVATVLSTQQKVTDTPVDALRPRLVLIALGLGGLPMLLVLAQHDTGTAMVLAAIVFGMIALSGASMRWVIGLILLAVVGCAAIVMTGALDDYQVKRLTAFADPTADPRGAGYNTAQARIAIGSGGLAGQGLFHGPQTQGRFVPEQQTDFIFTAAGEELGFIGAGAIIALFGLLLWRACRIGAKTHDLFGRLVVVGVVCWFGFQTFQNIGMCLGLMPVTGLPLPFVSYGGSAMFASCFAVGLLINVGQGNHDA